MAEKKKKYIEPGRRVMDMAYLRDGASLHTGEALVLACLLHAKGSPNRNKNDLEQIATMLDDPNRNTRRKK